MVPPTALDVNDPLDYDDLPDDAPGHDDPDNGPQPRQLPRGNAAEYMVRTAAGRLIRLCPTHAAIHRRRWRLDGDDDEQHDLLFMQAMRNWSGEVW